MRRDVERAHAGMVRQHEADRRRLSPLPAPLFEHVRDRAGTQRVGPGPARAMDRAVTPVPNDAVLRAATTARSPAFVTVRPRPPGMTRPGQSRHTNVTFPPEPALD